jgi:hypothetical protein
MEMKPAVPADIAWLRKRIVALGSEIEASRLELERLGAPGFDGLWATTARGDWTFHPRRGRKHVA